MPPKEISRSRIIRAAFDAFAEKGYDKTSMDDIVKGSGLSKGTLYWHFKNKQELFIATIQVVFQDFYQQLCSLVEMDTPAEARIRGYFGQVTELLESKKNLVGLLTNAFFQSYQDTDAQRVMWGFYEKYVQSIETIIQQGIDRGEFKEVDPHDVAITLMAGGDGIMFYSLLKPVWNLTSAMHVFLDLLLTGLRKDVANQ
jgi:AcrR family transcriptional regulator